MIYKVIKDGSGWGVIDETGTLINEEPIFRIDALKLAHEMNFPGRTIYADENPRLESWDY